MISHVSKCYDSATQQFISEADEATWSSKVVEPILRGWDVDGEEEILLVENVLVATRTHCYSRREFNVTDIDTRLSRPLQQKLVPKGIYGSLRVDLSIEASNRVSSSKLGRAFSDGKLPGDTALRSLSNFTATRGCETRPTFTVVEVKPHSGGNYTDAQTQLALAGVTCLTKARELGAGVDAVPCVPAISVTGHHWGLHLVYEGPQGNMIIGGPWNMGNTSSWLDTLKVVLSIAELKRYGREVWWPKFVDGVCAGHMV